MSETVLICPSCGRESDPHGRQVDDAPAGAHVVAKMCGDCDEARRHMLTIGRLNASGIPERPRRRRLQPSDPQAARAWASGDIDGLYIHGPVGAGKTWLAAACAVKRCEIEQVRWVSVPDLIARLLTAIDSDERREAVRDITGSHCLVLDDLDKTKPTEWLIAQLFVAIDARINAGGGLLVTSNLPLARVADRYGEAIASRLAGHCEVIELSGGDRRLAA